MSWYNVLPFQFELILIMMLFLLCAFRESSIYDFSIKFLNKCYRFFYPENKRTGTIVMGKHQVALLLSTLVVSLFLCIVEYGYYRLYISSYTIWINISGILMMMLFDPRGASSKNESERITSTVTTIVLPLIYFFIFPKFIAIPIAILSQAAILFYPEENRAIRTVLLSLPVAFCMIWPLITKEIKWSEVVMAYKKGYQEIDQVDKNAIPEPFYQLFQGRKVFCSSFLGTLAIVFGLFILGRIVMLLICGPFHYIF